MPEYTYTDKSNHITIAFHGMREDPEIVCVDCGAYMWRKPKSVAVNWGGLSPSNKPDSWVDDFLSGVPERRDKFVQEHEEHEKRTEHE